MKDSIPDLHRIADLGTRQALKTQADMVNAVRVEVRRAKDTNESTERGLRDLTTEVSRLGGLSSVLQLLSTNVNIALDHPWFMLGLAADQSIPNDTSSEKILWNVGLFGDSFRPFYDVDAADGFIHLGRKPGLWLVSLSVQWDANAVGIRAIGATALSNANYSIVDTRLAVTGGTRTTQAVTMPLPTKNPPGASNASWTRVACTAFQNSGGALDINGTPGAMDTFLTCFYLGPFPV